MANNIRNSRCTHPYKKARRERALVRLAERAQRSPLQQLDLLKSRPGQSKKERNRLTALVTTNA